MSSFAVVRDRPMALAAAGVIAGLAVGLLAVTVGVGWSGDKSKSSTDDEQSVGYVVPDPQTVDELVAGYDMAVIGSIEEVIRFAAEGPTDAPPAGVARRDAPPLQGAPFTYYRLRVEKVVSGPETVVAGDAITFRFNGAPENETAFGGRMLMPRPGDRRLFIVRLQPDGVSYGTRLGVLDISGSEVVFADKGRTSVRVLTDRATPGAFEVTLQEAMKRATPRPTAPSPR